MFKLPDDLVVYLPAINGWADAQPQVGRVWLYGSRVRGSHRPDSDLDVAIGVTRLLETDIEKEAFQTTLATGSRVLSSVTGMRVSVQSDSTPGVDVGVAECGVLIYERSSD